MQKPAENQPKWPGLRPERTGKGKSGASGGAHYQHSVKALRICKVHKA